MPKPLLTIILLCLLQHHAMSQRFYGGALFGFTASQVDGDTYAGYHQPGLTGGFYTYIQTGKNLFTQVEIKYTAKGARKTGTQDEPMLYQLKLRYVEVPLKLMYRFDPFKITLETGICQGYLMHSFAEGTDANQNVVELLDRHPLRKYEIGWLLGGSYDLTEKLKFSLIFNYSLLPIRRYANSSYNYGFLTRHIWMDRGDYNNNLQFVLYYKIE